jgi:rhamnose utilization protein RhaD (predicted bifunctional aldolase and dehydrogenase)
VTLSRNDFPWHEIAFHPFTAKECYEKFISIVKDPQIFLKKVLGLKEKYKKMMEG